MLKSRLFAASARAALGAGFCVLAFAAASVATAASPASPKLGAPYEAGGVWFVPADDPDYDVKGLAAAYGEGKDGERTFSGESFDPEVLAAAHATLPVPSVVEVTNLDNGRVMTLKINDRGPYAPGRIISLTPAAAHALGVADGASAHVRVRYAGARPSLRLAGPIAPRPPGPPSGRFGVQVGAFADRARAERVAAQLSSMGAASVTPLERGDAILYRVSLAASDAQSAEATRVRAEGLGFAGARVSPAQ